MSGAGEIESVLARFHQWLAEARADAASSAASAIEPQAEPESHRQFGLVDLVEEFTALRQELKLQTKSTRGLQEQAESLLPPFARRSNTFARLHPGKNRRHGLPANQSPRRWLPLTRRSIAVASRSRGPELSGPSKPPASSVKPSIGCTKAYPGCAASSCGGTTGK